MASTRIWSVASAKGGVGKSFVTSSLGISLARLNQRTLLVDLDQNGAHLHTTVGEPTKSEGVDAYFTPQFGSETQSLSQLIRKTKIAGLHLLHGFSFPIKLKPIDVQKLLLECRRLPYNAILVDLGPGMDDCYLEALRMSDERIFVTVPEPAALEKNYRLIENLLLYILKTHAETSKGPGTLSQETLLELLASFRRRHQPGELTLREHFKTEVGFDWQESVDMNGLPFRMIVNQVREEKDKAIGSAIKTICSHYFGLDVEFAGCLTHDNAVWQSAKAIEPTLLKYPFASLAGQFHSMSRKILNSDLHSQSLKLVV